MPGYDRTGPMGQGAKTGGGFGYCPPGSQQSDVNPDGVVYGVGRGGIPRGGGRGFAYGGGRNYQNRNYWPRRRFFNRNPLTQEEELQLLNKQKEDLEKRIEEITK
jgi:hypothetical protein